MDTSEDDEASNACTFLTLQDGIPTERINGSSPSCGNTRTEAAMGCSKKG
jgi:hypothetical protein